MTIDSVDESKVPSNDNNDSDVSSDEDDINLELENRTLQIAKKARLETDDSSSKKDTDDAQPDQKLIDLTGVGNINGKPVIDFDIDSMKDKPWMKKGENISDYFNYGFTEDTWKVYQLEIKGKSTDKLPPPPVVTQLSGPPPVIQSGSARMPPRSPASGPPPSGPPPRPPFSMPPGMPPGMAPPGFQMPPGMPPGMPPLMPPGGMAPPGMFTAKSEPSDEISVKTES